MKSLFTVRALFAIVSFGASMLITAQSSANQEAAGQYFYPYATSGGATYSQQLLTCNTNSPDWDSNCVNGDYISVKWWVRTTGQALVDIEYGSPFTYNLNGADDWNCSEVLWCNDGTTPGIGVYGNPCGWTACPSGVSAHRSDIYISMNY